MNFQEKEKHLKEVFEQLGYTWDDIERKPVWSAMDHGNAFFKFKMVGGGTILYPSYLVKADLYTGFNKIGIAQNEDEDNEKESIEKAAKFKYLNEENAIEWVWGPEETLKDHPVESSYTGGLARYPDLKYIRLSIFGIARAIPAKSGHFKVNLVTGVPSGEARKNLAGKDFSTKELELIKVLENDGLPHIVEITEQTDKGWKTYRKTIVIKVIYMTPQTMGSIANEAMTGKKEDLVLLSESVLALDIGGGNSSLTAIKNQTITVSESNNYGMKAAYEQIVKKLKETNELIEATPESVEQRIGSEFYSESRKKSVTPEEWTKIKAEVFKAHAQTIVNAFPKTINPNDYDHLFIFGGGAKAIGDEIVKIKGWEEFKVTENSQMSNVEGYYKLLQGFKKKAENAKKQQ